MKQQYTATIDDLQRQLAEHQRGQRETTEIVSKRESENARLTTRLAEAVTTITNLEESVSILEQENGDLQALVDALSDRLRRLTTNIRNSVDLSTVRFSVDLSDVDTESNFGWGEADEQLFTECETVVAASPSALTGANSEPSSVAHSPASPDDYDRTPRQSQRRKGPRKRPPLPGAPHTPPHSTGATSVVSGVKNGGVDAGPPVDISAVPVPRPRSQPIVGDVFSFAPPLPARSAERPTSEPAALSQRGNGVDGSHGGVLPFVSVPCTSVPGWDVKKIGTRVTVLRYGEGTLRYAMTPFRAISKLLCSEPPYLARLPITITLIRLSVSPSFLQ